MKNNFLRRSSYITLLLFAVSALCFLAVHSDSSAQESTTTSTLEAPPTIGIFNAEGLTPVSANQGTTIDVYINGTNTNFSDGATTISFSGTGITVNSTVVSSATRAVINITIDPDAPLGVQVATATTGTEIVTSAIEEALIINASPITTTSTEQPTTTTTEQPTTTTTELPITTTVQPTTTTVRPTTTTVRLTTTTVRLTTTINSSSTTTAAVSTTTTIAAPTTTTSIRLTTTSTAVVTTTTSPAGTITLTLAWSSNSEPDIAGYVIYYGLASRSYTFSKDVGNQTSGTVSGIVQGQTYYFALKAYTTSKVYSDYSAEISYPQNAVTTTSIGGATTTVRSVTTTIGGGATTTIGGGGGGGGVSSIPKTTTTTAITIKTTSTTSTIPACLRDADCDDSRFCNGKETCVDGLCVAGQSPCGEGQICREADDQCFDEITLSAYFMPAKVRRPLLLPERCTWMLLLSSGKNNFNENSTVAFTNQSGEAAGVKINPDRKAFALGSLIFLPVCIEKNAPAGEVLLTITSDVTGADTPAEETIQTSFVIE